MLNLLNGRGLGFRAVGASILKYQGDFPRGPPFSRPRVRTLQHRSDHSRDRGDAIGTFCDRPRLFNMNRVRKWCVPKDGARSNLRSARTTEPARTAWPDGSVRPSVTNFRLGSEGEGPLGSVSVSVPTRFQSGFRERIRFVFDFHRFPLRVPFQFPFPSGSVPVPGPKRFHFRSRSEAGPFPFLSVDAASDADIASKAFPFLGTCSVVVSQVLYLAATFTSFIALMCAKPLNPSEPCLYEPTKTFLSRFRSLFLGRKCCFSICFIAFRVLRAQLADYS